MCHYASSVRFTGIPLIYDAGAQVLGAAWSQLQAAAATWKSAIARQLVQDAAAARNAQPKGYQYSDLESLSWAYLALGANWVQKNANQTVKQDLAFSRLTSALVNLTVGGQARVGLAQLKASKTPSKDARNIVNGLLSNVRMAGQTGYIAWRGGGRYAAGEGCTWFTYAACWRQWEP